LTGGEKAGIGVGVALAVVALLALGTFLLWRRRKSRRVEPENAVDKPELPGADAEKKFSELETHEVAEVDGVGTPVELEPGLRHELDSGWQGHEAIDAVSSRVREEYE
jgi:MYXO-CTERM domain-containing protein